MTRRRFCGAGPCDGKSSPPQGMIRVSHVYEEPMTTPLLIAKAEARELPLLPRMANPHGLIAGATGTGNTVTLQALAEQFSRIGVPVFMADVKGDLSGMGQPGGGNAKVEARVHELGLKG